MYKITLIVNIVVISTVASQHITPKRYVMQNINNISPNKMYQVPSSSPSILSQYKIVSIPKQMVYSVQNASNRIQRKTNKNDLLAKKLRLAAVQNVMAAVEASGAEKQSANLLRNARLSLH
ncbi:unnamed protein product [Parnassius mnemosyne]|uniref:Uncharacterized protein n=1 Tax=Parnassius mnemosyne TaxID=213953 RepID=A0AAV1LCC7_9NEOP